MMLFISSAVTPSELIPLSVSASFTKFKMRQRRQVLPRRLQWQERAAGNCQPLRASLIKKPFQRDVRVDEVSLVTAPFKSLLLQLQRRKLAAVSA